ncbi:MAG: c-type cytochrome [Rhizomicrobium sp.]
MKRLALKSVAFAGLTLGVSLFAARASADENSALAPPAKVVTKCQACHGPGGDSATATVPRLNGQQKDYILKRLDDFLDPTREDPHASATMGKVMSEIDNASFAGIAAYYASQAPTQAQPGTAKAVEGLTIYQKGAAAPNLPACQTCHGAHAEGHGDVPRLAGQHGVYLTRQLERLRLAMRESKTMYHDIKAMTDAQIEALVAYLARN